MFEFDELVLDTPALTMRYHLAPWDSPTVGGSVAVIAALELRDAVEALNDFGHFQHWCHAHSVVLVTCKLPHARLLESGFLESRGFRFIELNYRPELAHLQEAGLESPGHFSIEQARPEDEGAIASIAGVIFDAGRFHRDPWIDPRVGDSRYCRWVANAFQNPRQVVLKCHRGSGIEGFFVVEAPSVNSRFWSLVGLAPGLRGSGLGTSVWRAMLRWHQMEGVDHVSTSISSLNVAVFNLYVKLGFRFPPPALTLHWCPSGRIEAPP